MKAILQARSRSVVGIIAICIVTVWSCSTGSNPEQSDEPLSLRWKVPADSSLQTTFSNTTPLIVDNTTVFFSGKRLERRSLEDGTLVWSHEYSEGGAFCSRNVLHVEDMIVFQTGVSLKAVHLSDGTIHNTVALSGYSPVASTILTYEEDRIFAGGINEFVVWNISSGDIDRISLEPYASEQILPYVYQVIPDPDTDRLYVPYDWWDDDEGKSRGGIICLSNDNDMVWSINMNPWTSDSSRQVDKGCYSGLIEDGHLFVNTRTSVLSINKSTGSIQWETDLLGGSMIYLELAYYQGQLFAGDSQGKVYCFDRLSGSKLWQQELHYALTTSFSFAGNRVFISTFAREEMWVLDIMNGELFWYSGDAEFMEHDLISPVGTGNGTCVVVGSQFSYCLNISDSW
ncbi:PQQ-binding-like beta-propeller repeat protein [bacterium]|nr:PQQ-binding-like beta-propeller repeat protein [bacterium]